MTESPDSACLYAPNDGDEVEVILRGKVRLSTKGDSFSVGRPGDFRNHIRGGAEHVVSITKVEPPEDWRPGDVVRDGSGRILVHVEDYVGEYGHRYKWLTNGAPGHGLANSVIPRPLTLLVRYGKVVSS